ncbi:phosphonoacetaldehyde reductase [Candidatus Pacearchaeota archaeon]|nr:phosphonoacetaldehyde reductase [Candidatus Pacearchaeota archaeon]
MIKQKEYFGVGIIEKLPEILDLEKPKKIFLVTGKNSYIISGAKDKLSSMFLNYKLVHFTDFSPDPTISDLEKGIFSFDDDCDLVIAVGGGSALDIAKSINVLSQQEFPPTDYLNKIRQIKNKGKPLVAIPTTSGSGSEATGFSVITSGHEKISLHHKFLIPGYSLIDPLLTMTLPQKITASTGIDALSQAMESYWSINSNYNSKKFSKKAITLCFQNLEDAVKKNTIGSRIAMSRAANLSGKAINITLTTAPHALSYYLTINHRVPHGHAVAMTLGSVLGYNAGTTQEECNDERGFTYVRQTILDLCKFCGCPTPKKLKQKISKLMDEIGLETRLSGLGLKEEDIYKMAESPNPRRLSNNPRKFTEIVLRKMLKDLF